MKKTYGLGLNRASCARLFNLNESTLFRAQQKEDRVLTNMKLSPVPRDKGEEQYELLTSYFESIPPKSGKFEHLPNFSFISQNLGRSNQHVFRGTEPECYLKYLEFCNKQTPKPTKKQIIQTPRIFHEHRRSFHIGIEKG